MPDLANRRALTIESPLVAMDMRERPQDLSLVSCLGDGLSEEQVWSSKSAPQSRRICYVFAGAL